MKTIDIDNNVSLSLKMHHYTAAYSRYHKQYINTMEEFETTLNEFYKLL